MAMYEKGLHDEVKTEVKYKALIEESSKKAKTTTNK